MHYVCTHMLPWVCMCASACTDVCWGVMHMCEHVYRCAHLCVYLHGSKRLVFSMFFYFTSDLLRQGFLVSLHCQLDIA